jgi:hypothetical protein
MSIIVGCNLFILVTQIINILEFITFYSIDGVIFVNRISSYESIILVYPLEISKPIDLKM